MLVESGGSGMYYFIESAEAITSSFAEALGSIISVLAQEIEVIVENLYDNSVMEIISVDTGYNVQKMNEKTWKVSIPDLCFEEKRDIVINSQIKDISKMVKLGENTPTNTETYNLVKFTVNYKNLMTKTTESQTTFGKIIVSKDDTFIQEEKSNIDITIDEQINRIKVKNVIEQAGKIRNYMDAKKLFSDSIKELNDSCSAETNLTKNLIQKLEKLLKSMINQNQFVTVSKKMYVQQNRNFSHQRSANSGNIGEDEESGDQYDEYQTSARTRMIDSSKAFTQSKKSVHTAPIPQYTQKPLYSAPLTQPSMTLEQFIQSKNDQNSNNSTTSNPRTEEK